MSFHGLLINNTFWTPKVSKTHDALLNKKNDLINLAICIVAISFIRTILSRFILKPIALWFNLREKKLKSSLKNTENLEKFFLKNNRPTNSEIKKFSKELKIDEKSLRNWFRQRRNVNKSSTQKKFIESSWRFTFYSVIFAYGLKSLITEHFTFNVYYLYLPYPNILSGRMYLYYLVEMSYYISSVFWLFIEVKRKDFFAMFLHHVVTITMILLSFMTCFTKVGTVILCLHDAADIFMEAAKISKYINKQAHVTIFFFIFLLTWIITRLIYFPFWVLHTTFRIEDFLGLFPGAFVFYTGLSILQVLHAYWFVLILRVAIQAFQGGVKKDSRSESEPSDQEVEVSTKKKIKQN